MTPEHLFLIILVTSLLSFGGLGSLPVLRSELSAAHIAPDGLILHAVAVGNISPGPNGLYLVAIGYFLDGPMGTAVACAALLLPPLAVVALERIHSRLIHLTRFRSALRSLSLAVVALFATTSGSLASHAAHSPLEVAMVLIGALLLRSRIPPVAIVAAAILVGLIAG